MKEIAVSYSDEKGQEIKLTGEDVIKYISTDESVTEKEVVQFLNMCKYLKLNPFLKEIYLIKHKGTLGTFVVSYQALLKRAEENPNFDGYETQIKGNAPDLTATAIVYRKDRTHPVKVSVKYSEAVKKVMDKASGQMRPTAMWASMPEWMLRKVALARALKEAFPSLIGNAVIQESEIVDIDSSDMRVQKELAKEDAQKALDDVYGVSEKEAEERKLTLYEKLKEKKIDTLGKVKDLLKEVFPQENWESIKKDVFEMMVPEKIQKVLTYLGK